MKLIRVTTPDNEKMYINQDNITHIVNTGGGNCLVFFLGGKHEEIEGEAEEQGFDIE